MRVILAEFQEAGILSFLSRYPAGDRIKSKGNNVNQQFQRSLGDHAREFKRHCS